MLRLLLALVLFVVPTATFAASGVTEDATVIRGTGIFAMKAPEGTGIVPVIGNLTEGQVIRVSCDEGVSFCPLADGSGQVRREDLRLERDGAPSPAADNGGMRIRSTTINPDGSFTINSDTLRDLGNMLENAVEGTPAAPAEQPTNRDFNPDDVWAGNWVVDFGGGSQLELRLVFNPGLVSGRFESSSAVVNFNGQAQGGRMLPTKLSVSPKEGQRVVSAHDSIEITMIDRNTLQLVLSGPSVDPAFGTARRGTLSGGQDNGSNGGQAATPRNDTPAAPASGELQNAVVRTAANLRTRPSSSNSRVVRTLAVGSEITVRCQNRWCQIQDDEQLWVFADLLRFTGAVAEAPAVEQAPAPEPEASTADEPATEVASFAGRWRLTLPDGTTSDMTIEQDEADVAGGFANGTERVEFTGSAGEDRVAGQDASGEDVELVLLGDGAMIVVNIAGETPFLATGRRLGDTEVDPAQNFEGLWEITGTDGKSQASIFQDGETISGVWGDLHFEGTIAGGRAEVTVREAGAGGGLTDSEVKLELVLLGGGTTLAINVTDADGQQSAVVGKRLVG